MAKRRGNYRSSPIPAIVMGILVIGMLGMGGLTVAWLAGMFTEPVRPAPKPIDRTGQLAFPALARNVPAFERLTKDDFINPRTKQLNVIWAAESLADRVSRDMSTLIGRVLRRDKLSGSVLSENDLLERGTRPGLSAGIPTGKFALSIPASGIGGLDQLRHGDRFDLLIALPKKEGVANQISNTEPAALFGGIKPPSLRVGQLSHQHGVKHLVTGGMLVQHYSGAKRSTSGPSGLTVKPGAKSKTTTSSTLYAEIAIDGEEIGPLTEAISLGTRMTCIMRSGKPNELETGEFSTAGLVPVITTSISVSAFSQLNDQNLIDESTGQLHLYYFPADKVNSEWIVDASDLYGRVVARTVRRGAFLTEADLLPKGTKASVSAGVPAGMVAMSLDSTNLQGFNRLKQGDEFSILTRVPESVTTVIPEINWATLQGGSLSKEDARTEQMVRTGIREVVRQAFLLTETQSKEVMIAVPESDVAKVAQLIRDQAEVFVVARSSQANLPATNSEQLTIRTSGSDDLSWEIGSKGKQFVSTLNPLASDHKGAQLVTAQDNSSPPQGNVHNDQPQSFPVLVRDVDAFTRLTLNDFLDPATGQLRMMNFSADSVDPRWESDIRQLIDRVAARKLIAGRTVFSSRDLAPKGALPGPSTGVPQGMRGLIVNSREILGIELLAVGETFDLIGGNSIAINQIADRVSQTIGSSDALREARKILGGTIRVPRVIADGAILVASLGDRSLSIERRVGKSETRTTLDASGNVVTETVIDDPLVEVQALTVKQFAIAVPEQLASTVGSLLDINHPMTVAVSPNPRTFQSINSNDGASSLAPKNRLAPVRAVIQQHIRGNDLETEVFLTDQPEIIPRVLVDG